MKNYVFLLWFIYCIQPGYASLTIPDEVLCPQEFVKVRVTQPEPEKPRWWQLEIMHVYSTDKALTGLVFPLFAATPKEHYIGDASITINGIAVGAVAIWPVNRTRPYDPIWDGDNKNPRPPAQSSHHSITLKLPYVTLPSFEANPDASPHHAETVLWAETLEQIAALPPTSRSESLRKLVRHEKPIISGWAAQVLLRAGAPEQRETLARQWLTDASLGVEARIEADRLLTKLSRDSWIGSEEHLQILRQWIVHESQDIVARHVFDQLFLLSRKHPRKAFDLIRLLFEQEHISDSSRNGVLGILRQVASENESMVLPIARMFVQTALDHSLEHRVRTFAASRIHHIGEIAPETIEQYILECETTMMTSEDDEHRERILELLRTKPKPRENTPVRDVKDMKPVGQYIYTGNKGDNTSDDAQKAEDGED